MNSSVVSLDTVSDESLRIKMCHLFLTVFNDRQAFPAAENYGLCIAWCEDELFCLIHEK